VINDIVGDRPISITYCDIRNSAVAFKGDRPGAPLSISQGGLFDGGMVLCVGKTEYAQETLRPLKRDASAPAFPYEPISPTRTTWGDWRRRHPETEICEDLPVRAE
jgi:hypothetical protein